jgi:hypothetical protein
MKNHDPTCKNHSPSGLKEFRSFDERCKHTWSDITWCFSHKVNHNIYMSTILTKWLLCRWRERRKKKRKTHTKTKTNNETKHWWVLKIYFKLVIFSNLEKSWRQCLQFFHPQEFPSRDANKARFAEDEQYSVTRASPWSHLLVIVLTAVRDK